MMPARPSSITNQRVEGFVCRDDGPVLGRAPPPSFAASSLIVVRPDACWSGSQRQHTDRAGASQTLLGDPARFVVK
jgi:hypothetical protein